jgi:hypothetical protein
MRHANPYRRKTGSQPATCLTRDLDPEDVDALVAPLGEPVRIGAANPWAGELPPFDVLEPFRASDGASPLAQATLGFGGERMVSRGRDPDEDDILARGQLWSGKGALLVRGRPCSCHENASEWWAAHQDNLVLATGYALSEDGLWRQHSWCVEGTGRRRVLETTTRRLLYLGFAMTADEAAAFHVANTRYQPRLAPAPERDGACVAAPGP